MKKMTVGAFKAKCLAVLDEVQAKRVTVVSRIVEESEFEWLVCLSDQERITGEIALHACRCLQIPPEQVELPDPEPAG